MVPIKSASGRFAALGPAEFAKEADGGEDEENDEEEQGRPAGGEDDVCPASFLCPSAPSGLRDDDLSSLVGRCPAPTTPHPPFCVPVLSPLEWEGSNAPA